MAPISPSSVSGISLISQHWHQFPIICFRHLSEIPTLTPISHHLFQASLLYPNIDTNFPSSVSGIHPCFSDIPTLTLISHHLSQVYTPVCLVSQHWHQFPIIYLRYTPLSVWYPNINTYFLSSCSDIYVTVSPLTISLSLQRWPFVFWTDCVLL